MSKKASGTPKQMKTSKLLAESKRAEAAAGDGLGEGAGSLQGSQQAPNADDAATKPAKPKEAPLVR